MDKETLKALKGSIKKWEKIVAGTGVDDGGGNCPLCKLFLDSCDECPVTIETDKVGCWCSPWERWFQHHRKKHGAICLPVKISCPTCTELAQKELDFLKSLLPERK